MTDFRKFLRPAGEPTSVLYLGGMVAFAPDRTLRLTDLPSVAPGFYAAKVTGRKAELGEPAEPFGLEALPAKPGHFAHGYAALEGGRFERIELLGAAEPEPLAPIVAREHPTGVLLLGDSPFEGEVEGAARQALEEQRGLGDLRGVGATLRLAFALATAIREGDALSAPLSPLEVRAHLHAIAQRGPEAAREVIGALLTRRRAEAEAREQAERARNLAALHERLQRQAREQAERIRNAPQRPGDPRERIERALTAAHASLVSARRLDAFQTEVTFRYQGERFVAVIDPNTLHVFDAGVCLDGADEQLTLESLPSVLREAIDTGRLVITRR